MDSRSSFATRLREAVARTGSHLCVGLDPRPELNPPEHAPKDESDEARAAASLSFCRDVIDAVADQAVAVKPQAAFFEAFGPAGFAAFHDVARHAASRGLIVVGDVKRGDIGSTSRAYAEAFFRIDSELGRPLFDCITINPYFGTDGIAPFVDLAVARGCGVFVLVKTSNPTSSELQDRDVEGRPLYRHVADLVNRWNSPHVDVDGYGPVGAVVGATHPEILAELRGVLTSSWLLLPGVGAQGAGVDDARRGYDSSGTGALTTLSRALTYPWSGGDAPEDWRAAIRAATSDWNARLSGALTP